MWVIQSVTGRDGVRREVRVPLAGDRIRLAVDGLAWHGVVIPWRDDAHSAEVHRLAGGVPMVNVRWRHTQPLAAGAPCVRGDGCVPLPGEEMPVGVEGVEVLSPWLDKPDSDGHWWAVGPIVSEADNGFRRLVLVSLGELYEFDSIQSRPADRLKGRWRFCRAEIAEPPPDEGCSR